MNNPFGTQQKLRAGLEASVMRTTLKCVLILAASLFVRTLMS